MELELIIAAIAIVLLLMIIFMIRKRISKKAKLKQG